MAKHDAIAAVSKGIVQLLTNAKGTFKGANGTLSIELVDGNKYNTGMQVTAEAKFVTVFLYRVAVNPTVRIPPQRRQLDGKLYHAPLPLDLCYLITPWANSIDVQHSLLGWAMRTLHDAPLLPATLLNDTIPNAPPLRPTDCVELTYDPVGLADLLGIWDKLKANYQTSATYIARMVIVESETEFTVAPPMQTREFDFLGAQS